MITLLLGKDLKKLFFIIQLHFELLSKKGKRRQDERKNEEKKKSRL